MTKHDDNFRSMTNLLQPILMPRTLTVSWTRLTKANEESIRLGFSRNLQNIEKLPRQWRYFVKAAFNHTARSDGLRNIRLLILLPTDVSSVEAAAESQVPVTLDVTGDTWRDILAENVKWKRRRRKR